MSTEWIAPALGLAADLVSWIAGLPEADRQKAIDAMRAAHRRAVDELAAFKTETDAELAAAHEALTDG